MRYKKFGKTGWDLSVISAGTWTLGGQAFTDIDNEEGIRALRALVEHGVNHVDTAAAYSNGESERLVGEALEGIRDKVYITTKTGLGPNGRDSSPATVRKQLEESLVNLRTDYVDNYVIHWPDPNVPFDDTMEVLLDLKEEGKIRAIGVSNFTQAQVEEISRAGQIDSFQMGYSMVSRGLKDLFEWAHAQGLGTMSYASLAAGILTGTYRKLPHFAEGDVRATIYDYFREPTFSQVMKLLNVMDAIAADRHVPLAQIAINWSTQQGFIDTALIGARNVREAEENCAGMEWSLTDNEMATLNTAIETYLGGDIKIFNGEA